MLKVWEFWGLGFRDSEFSGLGFRGFGFQGFWVWELQGFGF